MKTVERHKFVNMLPPVSANAGAFAGNTYVDTQGWSHLRVQFHCGALAADIGSTVATTPPKLEECDTPGGAYTDVAGAALGAVISAAADENLMKAIDVDLTKSHKRFMRVNAPTAGAGACLLQILGILSDKESGPAFGGGAAESGLAEKVSA